MEGHSNNHQNSWSGRSALWGGILIVLGSLFLLGQFMPWRLDWLIPVGIMGGFGFTFFSVYLTDRRHWWALIPAYVFWTIGATVMLAAGFRLDGDWVGSFFMYALAFPFFYVYLQNRQHWWALIPAYVFGVIGTIVMLASIFHFSGEWVGAFVTMTIALPFFYVYARNREHWWALIPGGIFASISIMVLLAGLFQTIAPLIPVAMIGIGIFLLLRNRGQKLLPMEEAAPIPMFEPIRPAPQAGPEADRPR